jgi:hypothetical protein
MAGDDPALAVERAVDWAAAVNGAFGFFTGLIARRITGFRAHRDGAFGAPSQGRAGGGGAQGAAPLLWCFSRGLRHEYGVPYLYGFEALGLCASDLMIIETANTGETLWALEEGIRSGVPMLVAGVLDDIELTPARRLALAAARHGVPCLVLSDARSPPSAATASRWRVGAAPSGPNELEEMCRFRRPDGRGLRLPGPRRFSVALERYRAAPAVAGEDMHLVEWRNEAVCFDLVAAVSDRPVTASARRAGRGG